MLAPVKAVSPFDTAGVGGGGGTDLRIVELLRIVENEAGRVGCFVVSHVPEQAWWCSGSARVRYHQGPGRAEPHGKPNVLAETMVTCRVRDSKEFEMCRERVCDNKDFPLYQD